MKMLKKNGGFTLVELIIVIAILAILAGVAVPAYSGYLTKANEAADMTQLDALKTAAVATAIAADPETEVTSITVDANGVVKINGSATATDISALYTFPGFKSGATSATWTSATSKWVLTK